MAIRSIALAALAATGLAACGTTYDEPAPIPAPVTTAPPVVTTPPASASTPVALANLQPGTYRPGTGILESIGLITLPASAAAGGTAPAAPVPGPYRLTLRMDDGNIQTLTADTRALLVGDRVQVTADGRLIRP